MTSRYELGRALLVAGLGWFSLAQADDTITQAVTFCPGGLAFGIVAAQYEVLVEESHGLVFRVDYEAIPDTYTTANIDSHGLAFIFSYRYHLKHQMASPYLGVFLRHRSFEGEGRLAISGQAFDFDWPETTVGLNIGKRWVWNNGFTLNFAFGYGISWDDREASISGAEVEQAMDDWEADYDFIDPFLGEFSIGYAF